MTVPWRQLPCDLWACVARHLGEMDRIRLFWTLWRTRVLWHFNIATCYRQFLTAPPPA
jgi:hypothetical protein